MAMTLAQGYLDYQDRGKKPDYHMAYTILANYLVARGSIRVENGVFTWDDTPQVFEDLAHLLTEVHNILLQGKTKDAREIKDRYFRPDLYKYLIAGESYPGVQEGISSEQ